MSSRDLEKLLAEAIAFRVRRGPAANRVVRRQIYELGFRDGWEAALSGVSPKPDPRK